jgi:threonine dehydratase
MIERARQAITPYLAPTPLVLSEPLSEQLCRPVYLKCENRQVTGAFKVRGALARLQALEGEARLKGVVAASAGNHALGIAWASRRLGVPALVVVPKTVARVKLRALTEMMIKLRVEGGCYDEAEQHARQIAKEADATFVSPFDDPWVMAGNGGTIGLEIRDELPDVSAVVLPVGGGGLASGLATALPDVAVVGVNSDASPAMARSIAERKVYTQYEAAPTIAEGLEGGVSASSVAFCATRLHDVRVVAEAALVPAIRRIANQHGMLIEGSAAVAVAALDEGDDPLPGADGPLVVVLTGRNIDKV